MNPNPGAKEVVSAAVAHGLSMERVQAAKLATYLTLLMTYNRRMNLVGPFRWKDVFDTLVVDSLHLAGFLPELGLPELALADGEAGQGGHERPLVLDLGAGAGLPGIPLRVFWEAGSYWLVEVRQRRASFMRTALGRLGLPRISVFEGRAEEALSHIAKQQAKSAAPGVESIASSAAGANASEAAPLADLILSRAFLPWRKLLGLVRPMLVPDSGRVVILANDPPPDSGAIGQGWELQDVRPYPVGGAERYFWALRIRS